MANTNIILIFYNSAILYWIIVYINRFIFSKHTICSFIFGILLSVIDSTLHN